jgi:hypothetical protein
MTNPTQREIVEIETGFAAIRPLLAGRMPHVQGAILGALVATFIAGHSDPDDPSRTHQVRKDMLGKLFDYVASLIPLVDPPPDHGS